MIESVFGPQTIISEYIMLLTFSLHKNKPFFFLINMVSHITKNGELHVMTDVAQTVDVTSPFSQASLAVMKCVLSLKPSQ